MQAFFFSIGDALLLQLAEEMYVCMPELSSARLSSNRLWPLFLMQYLDKQWPGAGKRLTDDIDVADQHGGQIVCREGVLYLTVPLEVFAKVEFNPSVDVFEARKPKDECSRLNNYVSSYAK